MDRWQVMDRLSDELGRAASLYSSYHPAGHVDQHSYKEDILTICSLKEQVQQQQMELQTKLAASEESTSVIFQEDKLIETSKELENEIENAGASYLNKKQTLHWMQVAHSLRTKAEENGEDSKLIVDMIKHIIEICSSIMEAKQDGRELEENVIEIRKKRLMLKETERALMSEIQTIKKQQREELEKQEHEELKMLQRAMEKEMQLTTLVQNIFQVVHILMTYLWTVSHCDPMMLATFCPRLDRWELRVWKSSQLR